MDQKAGQTQPSGLETCLEPDPGFVGSITAIVMVVIRLAQRQ